MRCPFSFCRSNHIGIKNITHHFVSSHSDFPIHYFFRLGQSQTNLKERVKEFFSSGELKSYCKPFGKNGKAIKGGNRKFIGLCRPIDVKINCPAFYTFESLYKNSILIVSFSLVHNHHKPIKQRLPHELAQIAKSFFLNEITEDEALQIDPNTRVINLKLLDQLISLAPEKEFLIISVVNIFFTNFIIKNNRRQSENKACLIYLFMVPFQKLKYPTFQLLYAKDVEIFLEPQILSGKSGKNKPEKVTQTRAQLAVSLIKAKSPPFKKNINSNSFKKSKSTYPPYIREEEEDPVNSYKFEEVDNWQDGSRFCGGFCFMSEVKNFCKDLGNFPRTISADVTFKVVFRTKLKLLTVFYFDKAMRRRTLLLAIIGSESSFFFNPVLGAFLILLIKII